MKAKDRFWMNLKNIGTILFFVSILSIALLLIHSEAFAQTNYPIQSYWNYTIPNTFSMQNLFPYHWQNLNLMPSLTYPSNFRVYPSITSQMWNQYTPGYNLNSLNLSLYNSIYSNPAPYSYSPSVGLGSPANLYPGLGNILQGFNQPMTFYNMYQPIGFSNYYPGLPTYYPMPGPSYTPEIIQPIEMGEYLALLPQVLHMGAEEMVSISFLGGVGLTRYRTTGMVTLTLSKGGEKILEKEDHITGKGSISFIVPEVEVGEYELGIKGEDFQDKAKVSVVDDILVFLQTDKPIYQPGQTIHMRVITLNSELRPISRDAVIEAQDAKGIKIFRKQVITDEYGLADLDLPISSEPNLGVWKITVLSGQANTQTDVRVETYVLPKYEVKVELLREWFLVNEPIAGKVKAEYSFGKPVMGDLEIKASRYVGDWELYETFSTTIDAGEADFEISPVEYVAGVVGAGGMGNVTLDVTVKERNTGYEEKTNRLITISGSPFILQLIPESSVFKPSLPFSILVVAKTPDHDPYETMVGVEVTYINTSLSKMGTVDEVVMTTGGKALLTITPPSGCVALDIQAVAEGGRASKAVLSGYSPSGNFIHLEQISQGVPEVGEEIRFKVHSTNEAVHFYYEVISLGRVIFSDFTNFSEIEFTATPQMAPQAKILVYQILPNSEVAADYMPFEVEASYPLSVDVQFSAEEV
ncbi:MAG: MG2 domain-containing protein, partial [bacterium]